MQTKRLDDFWQWRYDHDLSDEELRTEEDFNREMHSAAYRDCPDAEYTNIYWLLTEWRKNSKLLLDARTHGDSHTYNSLLSHRAMLNYWLNVYLRTSFTKGAGRPRNRITL